MNPPFLHLIKLDSVIIGLLLVAAAVCCLALALSGYRASVGVILIVCAVEAMLYWLWRTQRQTQPKREYHPVPFAEPVTGAH